MKNIGICFILVLLCAVNLSCQLDQVSKDIIYATKGNCKKEKGFWTEWKTASASAGSGDVLRYRMCYSVGRIVEVERQVESCEGAWTVIAPCCQTKSGGLKIEEYKCNSTKTSNTLRVRYCNKTEDRGDPKNKNTFGIKFLRDTTSNLPTVRDVSFPAADGISVCFWFNVSEYISHGNAAVTYVADEISNDNDLGVWFNEKQITVFMRESEQYVLNDFPLNVWTHFCWVWNKNGSWSSYVNGVVKDTGSSSSHNSFIGRFPKTNGYVVLGQDTDRDSGRDVINDLTQTFHGEISQLYIYHTNLTAAQVLSSYKNAPVQNNVVTKWEEFKGKANGKDVIETKFQYK